MLVLLDRALPAHCHQLIEIHTSQVLPCLASGCTEMPVPMQQYIQQQTPTVSVEPIIATRLNEGQKAATNDD